MRTKQKDFRDDDSSSACETLWDQTEVQRDSYYGLFQKLVDRAEKHGFQCVVVLSYHDPMSNYSAKRMIRTGNYFQNCGAVRAALVDLEHEG